MNKIYIAAPFFNDAQLRVVEKIETYLAMREIEYFSPRSEGVIINMTPEQKANALSRIYESNVSHIKSCDKMIAVIDGMDKGVIFELGFAAALGKKIITLSTKQYGLNVMISQCVSAHVGTCLDAVHCVNGQPFKQIKRVTVT